MQAEISKTEIRAPFDDVVGLRFVSVGAYVTPNIRIATLQRIRELKVDFPVPERYIRHLRPGSPISFTVAGSSSVYHGTVYAVDLRIDINTRTVLLRAHRSDADKMLFPGLFARVEFTVHQDSEALLVPAIAVLYGLDERFVFVARDGKAERVKVALGARTDTHVQISEGLHAGDVVLVTGIQQLRPGIGVTVELVEN
ncbi:MAG: efflux RND transporter periplasmic adaptor subunit [Candidatus Synoicihabitans palmerolidicus]|nr:efflux RND transporter periplasmic adaptor subunit [Candidatus Synoicihabitans palmerolidicus]